MKTVDINLFAGNPFEIKTTGKTYIINFVSSIMELRLMQEQEEITIKASKWKLITNEDLITWKGLIKEVISENKQEIDESDMDNLRPLDVLGILMALMSYLTERSKIVYEGLVSRGQKRG